MTANTPSPETSGRLPTQHFCSLKMLPIYSTNIILVKVMDKKALTF